MLGQTSWVNKYYERRAKEIDNKLNISSLEKRQKKLKSVNKNAERRRQA